MEVWKNERANIAQDAARDKFCLKNCTINFDPANPQKLQQLTLVSGIASILNKSTDVTWDESRKTVVFRFRLDYMYAQQKRTLEIRKRYSDFKRLEAALVARYQTQLPHAPNETLGYHYLPTLCKDQAKVQHLNI